MFKVRYADISDVRKLAQIHSSSWKKAYKGIISDELLENITIEKRGIFLCLRKYQQKKN
ncbi:MAG: hypothetical protein E6929_13505 [Clostridium sp.]|nr:hypothetical protein [Clostridium sp.]